MVRSTLAAVLIAWLQAGCECALSHERDGGPDATSIDAAPGIDAPTLDSASPDGAGAIDARARLDGPEAIDAPQPLDAWVAPDTRGPIDAGATCVSIGDPFLVNSRATGGDAIVYEVPELAWGAGRWAFLAQRVSGPPDYRDDPHAVIYERASDWTTVRPTRVLEPGVDRADAIVWADGRWAIGLRGATGGARALVGLFDADFAPVTGWIIADVSTRQVALARLSAAGRWLSLWQEGDALVVHALTDAGVETRVEHPSTDVGAAIRAAGVRDRVAALVPSNVLAVENEIVVIGGPPSYSALGRIPVRGRWGHSGRIVAVGDRAIAIGIEAGALMTAVADPVAMTLTAGERAIAEVPGDHFALGAAGSEAHGVAGVCWGGGDAGLDATPITVSVSLVGLDGEPRGGPAIVAETTYRVGIPRCAIAADDEGFLVSWWTGFELWARRVRVSC